MKEKILAWTKTGVWYAMIERLIFLAYEYKYHWSIFEVVR